jgi:hypothetical protein
MEPYDYLGKLSAFKKEKRTIGASALIAVSLCFFFFILHANTPFINLGIEERCPIMVRSLGAMRYAENRGRHTSSARHWFQPTLRLN